jgi:hypothetical protein
MKTFTLFWLTGQTEVVKGNDIADAMTKAGYGGGAIRALDFYGNGDNRDEYVWNKEKQTWDRVKPIV